MTVAIVGTLRPAMAESQLDTQPPRLHPTEPLEWGAMTIGSHAPLSFPRLRYTPGRIDVLPVGVWEFDLRLSHTNAWAERPTYFLDGEFSRMGLRAHVGFAHSWEAYVDLTVHGRSDGILDGFIEGFHDLFGVTQARRDFYDRDELLIIRDRDTTPVTTLDSADAGVGMANPVLGLRYQVIDGYRWRPAITLEAAVKLPVGDLGGGYATNGWDTMFHASIRQPLGFDVQLLAAGGVIYSPGSERIYGFEARDFQWSAMLGLHIRIVQNFAFVFQYLHQTGVGGQRNYPPQHRGTHEFIPGFQWAPTGRQDWLLEFGVIENSINDANTPDFGLFLAIRWNSRQTPAGRP